MKEKFLKLVSNEIKIIRIENRDSQEELSKKTGIAPSTISKYESGEQEMKTRIEQLVTLFGTKI